MKSYALLSWLLTGFVLSSVGGTLATDAPTTLPALVDMVASGVGRDETEATKDALVNAVRQAIGSVVSAETLVQNDQIVRDQILAYSDGFVEKYELVGKPRTANGGLVEVTVRAHVHKGKLAEKIRSAKITMRDFDGESKFGAAVTVQENRLAAEAAVMKELDDIPRGLIKAETIGEPNYDDRSERLNVSLVISIDQSAYDAFVKRVTPSLKAAAIDTGTVGSVEQPIER